MKTKMGCPEQRSSVSVGGAESGVRLSPAVAWLMITRGPGQWNYIPAEAPCWKGEINFSLRWFSVVIGWQRKGAAA